MEIETLKRSHVKRNIVIAMVIVAIKVDGREVDTLPDGNYELTSESYCTINNEKDNNIKLSYDSESKTLTVTPMTKKGTKCYLYFDEQKILLADAIKRDNQINSENPNFASVATTNDGVYKAEDDWGESYYFRGAVGNNWVRFAGYYWRIIRINGDGSIRLIYNGTSTATTGESTMINSSQAFNTNSNSGEYAGYMYTTGQQHGNTTSSTIKGVLDNWYNNNLKSYEGKISTEAGFCGDREMAGGYEWSGGSNNIFYYISHERLANNKIPSLKCSNNLDLYTVNDSSKGNKALMNPIGLITADEVAMAGGVYGQANSSYYLYIGRIYLTMSPSGFYNKYADVFYVHSNGQLLNNGGVGWTTPGVRPVINIASDAIISSGDGTSSNPYTIS